MMTYKEIVKKIAISPEMKIKQKDYCKQGQLAIIDQGQQLIGGYTNDVNLAIPCNLPVIVFGDHTRAVKYVPFPFGAGADGIKVLQPKTGVFPKFLYYLTQYLVLNLEDRGYARHYQYLEKKNVTLPTFPEQERIVARIEELFSQLDNGVETLKLAKQQLATYRQAVLKEAFEGKLTADWRLSRTEIKHSYVNESREKRDCILKQKHQKPLKYGWKTDIDLPKIPTEWEYAQIGDVAWSIKDGPHYSPQYSEKGVPFITGGNVKPSGIDFESAKHISWELHKELCKRCCPENGDMLYTKGGTTGIARVNSYDREFSVWVHVAVIKFVDSLIPTYFQYVLNSPLCYQQSQKYTHGVGNQDLGLTRMVNIIFPLCSVEEQEQVIKELESRLSACDSIEQTIDTALQQAGALRESILKKAFEGGLA